MPCGKFQRMNTSKKQYQSVTITGVGREKDDTTVRKFVTQVHVGNGFKKRRLWRLFSYSKIGVHYIYIYNSSWIYLCRASSLAAPFRIRDGWNQVKIE